jgi:hypothetical protein
MPVNCNQLVVPKFTTEQIARCKGCQHISKSKAWCCYFGVWIQEKGAITVPQLINFSDLTTRLKYQYKVSLGQYKNYRQYPPNEATKDMEKDAMGGFVDEDTYIKRRQSCLICDTKQDCECLGCKRWPYLVCRSAKCPRGRW